MWRFLLSVVRILLNMLVVISAAIELGIPSATFITILGSAGLAIGLSLQGSLSNLAGSLILMLFKPFRVGDYVDAGGVSGTVEEINIFYTVIRTVDNKLVTCPNGSLSNANITNYSKQETRRVDLVFSAAYDCDVEQVRQLIFDQALQHPLILHDPEPFVRLSACASSSMDFTARLWCKNEDYWTVYFDMLESVKKAFDEQGIEIPYPQMDVHVKNS